MFLLSNQAFLVVVLWYNTNMEIYNTNSFPIFEIYFTQKLKFFMNEFMNLLKKKSDRGFYKN